MSARTGEQICTAFLGKEKEPIFNMENTVSTFFELFYFVSLRGGWETRKEPNLKY